MIHVLLIKIVGILVLVNLVRYHYRRWDFYKMSAKLDGPVAWPFIGSSLLFIGETDRLGYYIETVIMLGFVLVSFVLVLLFILLFQYHWKRWPMYVISSQLPGAFAYPIIGSAFRFWCSYEEIMDKVLSLVEPYKNLGRFWLGPKLFITVSDAENAKTILSSHKITHKDDFYRFMGDFIGQGLIPGSGEKWKAHRKIIKPTLNNHILSSYLEVFSQQTDILVESMAQEVGKPPFDLIKYSHLCAVDIVMETLVDVKVSAQENNNTELVHWLERSYTMVHERMCKVWLHSDFIFYKTPLGREQIVAARVFRGFLDEAIKRKREAIIAARKDRPTEFMTDNIPRKCTAEHLLEIVMDDPTVMTHEELIDEIGTLFSASEDTSSTIYSFTMMMLGMYPEYQDKVVSEYEEVLGVSKQYDIQSLNNLRFLEMCIKESLRILPIAPFILRKVTEEMELGPHKLPLGATCLISIYTLHYSKLHWERPHDFYPYHFLPEVIEKRHPYTWMPFSMGPRACLGKTYAMLLLKIMIVNSLRRFRVEADGKLKDLKIYADISCRVKGGCKARIFNRN